jgi:oxaloacetate decarboxylase gamma subunit
MTILEMLEQSAILTILGMTVVFAFLWLMIVCVNLIGSLIRKLGMDKDVQDSPGYPVKTGTPPQIAAAITAAVKEYQKKE